MTRPRPPRLAWLAPWPRAMVLDPVAARPTTAGECVCGPQSRQFCFWSPGCPDPAEEPHDPEAGQPARPLAGLARHPLETAMTAYRDPS